MAYAQPTAPVGRHPAILALYTRGYRWLWLASLFTWSALQMQGLARGYLARDLTKDPFIITAVFAMGAAPIIFAPFAGALADRVDRKLLVAITEAANLGVTVATAVLITTGAISIPALMALGFMSGFLMGVTLPARQAMIADLVEPEAASNGLVLFNGVFNVTMIAGPAAAGFIVKGGGVEAAYYTALAVNVIGLLLMLRVPRTPPSKRMSGQSAIQTFTEGFRYIGKTRFLAQLLLGAGLVTMFSAPYQSLLPVFQRDVLKVDAAGLGWLQTATGVGGLIAAVVLAIWATRSRNTGWMLSFGVLAGLSVAGFARSELFWLSVFLMLLVGLFQSLYMIINMTLVQVVTPKEFQGRVFSIRIVIWGVAPLGQLAVGGLANAYSPQTALAIFGLTAAATQIGMLLWLRGTRAPGGEGIRRPAK
jgi:MFS family permease